MIRRLAALLGEHHAPLFAVVAAVAGFSLLFIAAYALGRW